MSDLPGPPVPSPEPPETPPSEPHWLGEEETNAWLALLTVLLQLPGPLESQLQHDAGIGLFEYLVLSSLSMERDRSVRMNELARLTNGSPSRLSNVVKRLEQRGWIRRQLDPQDGRYTVATLTDSGWDLVVDAAPGHVEAVRHYAIDPLTAAQVRTLTTIGRRISDRIGDGPLARGRDTC